MVGARRHRETPSCPVTRHLTQRKPAPPPVHYFAIMQLTSEFRNGGPIRQRCTCDGQNQSPPLSWTAPPPRTQSFVLLCDDPDAPRCTWHHWAIHDIPAAQRSLNAHYPRNGTTARQGLNDFQRIGYDGPWPPPGDAPHHYRFRLHALSVARLAVPANGTCTDIAAAAHPHILATATLAGTYQR
jgi:Raf kinase inhibitor-like YbhB/YbcL family protein